MGNLTQYVCALFKIFSAVLEKYTGVNTLNLSCYLNVNLVKYTYHQIQ